MTLYRVQHQFNHSTGMAEDVIVNTFHFTSDLTLDQTVAQQLATLIRNFYETSGDGVAPQLSNYLCYESIAPNAHTAKFYSMADAPPRAPLFTINQIASVAPTQGPLPSEVALCLSYRAALASGTVAARRRGRLYIGPLANNAIDQEAITGWARPAAGLMQALLAAGVGLAQDAAAAGFTWVVYSSATQDAQLPNGGDFGTFPITQFSVDNAFDTQRRRGAAPSTRFTANVA